MAKFQPLSHVIAPLDEDIDSSTRSQVTLRPIISKWYSGNNFIPRFSKLAVSQARGIINLSPNNIIHVFYHNKDIFSGVFSAHVLRTKAFIIGPPNYSLST